AQDALALADAARLDAADGDVAEVVVVVEGGDVHGQRRVDVGLGRRHEVDDQVQQRAQVAPRVVQVAHRPPLAPRRVDDGEVELRVAGPQGAEEVEGGVDGALRVAPL